MHCSKLKVPGKAQKLGGQLLKADEELGLLKSHLLRSSTTLCTIGCHRRAYRTVSFGFTGVKHIHRPVTEWDGFGFPSHYGLQV